MADAADPDLELSLPSRHIDPAQVSPGLGVAREQGSRSMSADITADVASYLGGNRPIADEVVPHNVYEGAGGQALAASRRTSALRSRPHYLL